MKIPRPDFSFLVLADTQISVRSHLDEPKKAYTRFIDHGRFFEQVKTFMGTHPVDLVVHAGDVFDDASPENPAQDLFADFVHWVTVVNKKDFLVCLGNHDGTRKDNPVEHLRMIGADENGSSRLVVSPFNHQCKGVNFQSYDWTDYKNKENFPPVPLKDHKNILIAHAPILGARMNQSYQPKDIGLTSNGNPWDLIILGHYHLHQDLKGFLGVPSCYVGSSIKEDFGEMGQTKGFVYAYIGQNPHWAQVAYDDVPFVQVELDPSEEIKDWLSSISVVLRGLDRAAILKLKISFTDREQLGVWDRTKGSFIKGLYENPKVLKVITDPQFAIKNPVRSREYDPTSNDEALSLAYLKSEKELESGEEEKYKNALQELLK